MVDGVPVRVLLMEWNMHWVTVAFETVDTIPPANLRP